MTLYHCTSCKGNLPREGFYTHTDGRRYRTCRRCISKTNNARKVRGDKPLLNGGTSYKRALRPEQWGAMESYLRCLLYCADVAAAAGVTPDVWEFTRVYARREAAQSGR